MISLKVERMNLKNELKEKIWRLKNMDFEDEEFIKKEQSDDLLTVHIHGAQKQKLIL